MRLKIDLPPRTEFLASLERIKAAGVDLARRVEDDLLLRLADELPEPVPEEGDQSQAVLVTERPEHAEQLPVRLRRRRTARLRWRWQGLRTPGWT